MAASGPPREFFIPPNWHWRLFYWALVFLMGVPLFFVLAFASETYRDGLCPPDSFARAIFRGWQAVFGGTPWLFVALSLSALILSLLFRALPWSGARDAALERVEASFRAVVRLRCQLFAAALACASVLSLWNVPAVACASPEGLSRRDSGLSPMVVRRWSEVATVVASCDLGRFRGDATPFFVVLTFRLAGGDEIRLDIGQDWEEVGHRLVQVTSALRGVHPYYEASQDARRCPYDVQQALWRVSFLD